MRPFNFESASSPEAALKAQGRFLAGGTTLLDLMKLEVETPDHLVDVSRLPLSTIKESKGSIWIGAMALNSDVAHSSLIQKRLPVLSEALLSGASPQLRNLATTGGNLLQRTRCGYFRDTAWACNKRERGSGCSALEGFNRSHAVLGTSDACIATSPSDMNVALMALSARVHIRNASSSRIVNIEDFYKRPGNTPDIETVIMPGDLISEVEIPVQDWYRHSHYVKVRDRASYAFALASAAVVLHVSGSSVREARIALGGIATVPWRSHEAEKALTGSSLTEASYRKAADAALAGAKAYKHNAFKIELARETIVRALSEMGGRT